MKHLTGIVIVLMALLLIGVVGMTASLERLSRKYAARMVLRPTGQPTNETPRVLRPLSGIPSHLFDIKLEIDAPVIEESHDLTARVFFTSFGTVPTPVAMIFTIINGQNEMIRQERDVMTVETEAVFRKSFTKLPLEPGRYTLVLKTIYDNTVEDEFTQEFAVKRKKFLGIF